MASFSSIEAPEGDRSDSGPPEEFLQEWGLAVRGGSANGHQVVLCTAASDPQALDDIAWWTEALLEVQRVPEAELERYLAEEPGVGLTDLVEALRADDAGASEGAPPLADITELARQPTVIRLVNLLLVEALEARASDVHLEAAPLGVRVRFRIDGILIDGPAPPASYRDAVFARIKVMAELDVAERRRPQDGRMRLRVRGRPVDVRVSTIPTLGGESLVLRLLEAEGRQLSLDGLGMAPDTLETLSRLFARPNGLLLATGPTGGGKTTTLYSALERLRTGREKIVTVEDPVEYGLEGVAQVPVNRKAGVTFASVLRSILRQDPDVIMVGEMRDPETAEICTQAALTGHLVLSTLHTNDASGALVRLRDLGVEPFLIASTVVAVLAQRLIRVVCTDCEGRLAVGAGANSRRTPASRPDSTCELCRGTGYRGRTGIYELLVVDDAIRRAVIEGASAASIAAIAARRGMRTLAEDALRHVDSGRTTSEEVKRVTR